MLWWIDMLGKLQHAQLNRTHRSPDSQWISFPIAIMTGSYRVTGSPNEAAKGVIHATAH